ncbi:hypothetical protein ACO0QE_000312 [Hanseniaspora vineae]
MEVLAQKFEKLDQGWANVPLSDNNTQLLQEGLDDNEQDKYRAELDNLAQTDKIIDTILSHSETYSVESHDFIKIVDTLSHELNRIKEKSVELENVSSENQSKLSELDHKIHQYKLLSPNLVERIIHGTIDAQWCEDAELVVSYSQESASEETDLCMILKHVVLERCKRKLVESIKKLRTFYPSQVVQKELLSVPTVFEIIRSENKELAEQLFQAYCNTMQWYYTQFFARYTRSLTIMQYHQIDANYKFGGQLSYYYSMLSGVVGVLSVNDYFKSVNKRIFILSQENSTVMVSQIAETNTVKNFLEIGFKNLNLCILNNYHVESEFITNFFQQKVTASDEDAIMSNTKSTNECLQSIFRNVFANAETFTKNLIAYTFDFYGILLCIRISQIYIDKHASMTASGEPAADPFEEYLNNQLFQVLWPKFQSIINNNLNNVTDISNVDPDQFISFLQGILIISTNYNIKVEPLYQSLMNILNNFETYNLQKTHAGNKTYQLTVFNKLVNLLDSMESEQAQDSEVDNSNDDETRSIVDELKERYINCIKNV